MPLNTDTASPGAPHSGTYQVIGLMSGTSLDGVDVTWCSFTEANNIWIYKILNAATIPYPAAWKTLLTSLSGATAAELAAANHLYGDFLGKLVKNFIGQNGVKPQFVASHGHTIFHQPDQRLCLQLGSGADLAAAAELPVVCDFRSVDIALGGQGAPLVPIGDRLLFGDYTFCLNLGGIANISMEVGQQRLAYDICVCNIALNHLAGLLGHEYDAGGEQARRGNLNQELLQQLNAPAYYTAPAPKSLGREWVEAHVLSVLQASALPVADQLCTVCHHIAQQIATAVKAALSEKNLLQAHRPTVLATGGGAFNTYLIELLNHYLNGRAEVVLPEPEVINYKEALIFAFLGVLRWRKQANCLQSVTGASRDNVGGAVYWY